MARPKKQQPAAPKHGYTLEAGENGKWLVRNNGKPVRVFAKEEEAKKYVDYMVSRG